jgi:hypothetical protein
MILGATHVLRPAWGEGLMNTRRMPIYLAGLSLRLVLGGGGRDGQASQNKFTVLLLEQRLHGIYMTLQIIESNDWPCDRVFPPLGMATGVVCRINLVNENT